MSLKMMIKYWTIYYHSCLWWFVVLKKDFVAFAWLWNLSIFIWEMLFLAPNSISFLLFMATFGPQQRKMKNESQLLHTSYSRLK